MFVGFFRKPVGRQYVAAFVASLSVMMAGTSFGWPSPVLAKLANGSLKMEATNEQQSWMIAMLELGNLLSPIPFGVLVDLVGRKPCLLMTGPLYIISWLMVLSSKTIGVLYWVRLLQGACIGIVTTVVPIYIGEIAGDNIRGALSTFFNGMLNAGILYVYCVGPLVSYDVLTYFSLLVPCVFLVACVWIPESPYYYVIKDNDKKAHEALAWLHGGRGVAEPDAVLHELLHIKTEVKNELQNKGSMHDLFGSQCSRKAFGIVQIVAAADVLSGMTTVLAYASSTFAHADTVQTLSPDQFTMLLGVLIFCTTFVTGFLVDKLGRRPLLLFSCFGCGAFELVTGMYYYKRWGSVESLGAWIPFTAIGSFAVIYSIGLGPLLPTLQGEMFPSNVRGLASAITSVTLTVISFIGLKMYQVITDNWGIHVNYFIYGTGCLVSFILIYHFLPETKGKTFAQIQSEIMKTIDDPQSPPTPVELDHSRRRKSNNVTMTGI
ncbi:Sugar transporter, conserved site,Major facilitator superfamily domain,Major facilitator, sugar [Cinara cedri]|uniref:Sugar transporter, conserved site,Major facilitator superfamily domain,Major facilitator, sugar n=1 Tax=Cinara cedri TaxID=506608 RepID=A0A5E4NHI2_9HEMI|nr:Sugar transporter, conserved site,Major facilitator superfamily domain,Major facilitator, sugar [Cinara cedri]